MNTSMNDAGRDGDGGGVIICSPSAFGPSFVAIRMDVHAPISLVIRVCALRLLTKVRTK